MTMIIPCLRNKSTPRTPMFVECSVKFKQLDQLAPTKDN